MMGGRVSVVARLAPMMVVRMLLVMVVMLVMMLVMVVVIMVMMLEAMSPAFPLWGWMSVCVWSWESCW